jgi:hypothetical protein
VECGTIEVVTLSREVVRIRDEEANLRDVGTVKA